MRSNAPKPFWKFIFRLLSFYLFFFKILFCSTIPVHQDPNYRENQIEPRAQEVLKREKGVNACLVTNQAGLGHYFFWKRHSKSPQNILKEVFSSYGKKLILFSAEHGISGLLEGAGNQYQVKNIYKKTSKSMAASYKSCDFLILDLPDSGIRPWTYRTIILRTLFALENSKIPVYLIDHPNPASKLMPLAPIAQPALYSYLGEEEIPFFPKLTLGELALAFYSKKKLKTNLKVLPIKNYQLEKFPKEKAWSPPSPNLPTTRSLRCYWIAIFLEGVYLEIGRSLKDPFCTIAHPLIDLNWKIPPLSEIHFKRLMVKPTSGPFKNKIIPAFQMSFPRNLSKKFDPVHIAYKIIQFLITKKPNYRWLKSKNGSYLLDKITGDKSFRKAIQSKVAYQEWKKSQKKRLKKTMERLEESSLY